VAAASDLGLLANYYQDCPASHGPHDAYLQSVIRRALRGNEAAMRLLIMHKGIFSTGDNEASAKFQRHYCGQLAMFDMLRS